MKDKNEYFVKNFPPPYVPSHPVSIYGGGITSLGYKYHGFFAESLLLEFRIEAWLETSLSLKPFGTNTHKISNLLIAKFIDLVGTSLLLKLYIVQLLCNLEGLLQVFPVCSLGHSQLSPLHFFLISLVLGNHTFPWAHDCQVLGSFFKIQFDISLPLN